MTDFIDLRSDTVTRPVPAMREAMASAPVGDDVLGEDPTILELEAQTAQVLGKEAALFVPSGTMANQIALSLLAGPGTEVLVEADSHVLNYEAGAASALWGITTRTVSGERGMISAEDVRWHRRPVDEHNAPLVAVALENTHNRAAGAVWPMENLDEVTSIAHELGIHVHLDGARLWNAAAYLQVPESRLARDADTVSVCFSKGLGAPVGSVVASTQERIGRGRVARKRLGGGMRQAGIIAAGALYALHHHRVRLSEDHEKARKLAECVEGVRGVSLLPVQTNMVIVDLTGHPMSPETLVQLLSGKGVEAFDVSPTRVRMVTHLDVSEEEVVRAGKILRTILEDG